jgi:DNA-binding MarR family transcriptional regulator
LVADPTPDELESVAEFRVALRRFLAASENETAASGLTARQYDLLAVLHHPARPRVTPGSVADELALSKSAATELLSRAVKAGLVHREIDPANARTKLVTATPEGTRRFFGAVIALRSERARLFAPLRVAAGMTVPPG